MAVDWTAWGGIGMATRGSIPKIMAAAGVDMLPPEAGVAWIRRELATGMPDGEVVVAGALGALAAEFQETGGIDPAFADGRRADGRRGRRRQRPRRIGGTAPRWTRPPGRSWITTASTARRCCPA